MEKNFRKNYEKIYKNNEKIKALNEKKHNYIETNGNTWGVKNNDQYKEYENEIEFLSCQNKILKNNCYFIIYEIFEKECQDILKKYTNKTIGEKTKEKIQNEINDLYKEKNINLHCYLNFGTYNEEITFYILNDENYTDYNFEYKSAPHIYFSYYSVEKSGNFTGNLQHSATYFVEDEKKEAKRILTQREKSEKKLKELKTQMEKIKNDFNETLHGETYDKYYINLQYIY